MLQNIGILVWIKTKYAKYAEDMLTESRIEDAYDSER